MDPSETKEEEDSKDQIVFIQRLDHPRELQRKEGQGAPEHRREVDLFDPPIRHPDLADHWRLRHAGTTILTQNVAMQIGIPTKASDGNQIFSLKRYVQMCYACGKTMK